MKPCRAVSHGATACAQDRAGLTREHPVTSKSTINEHTAHHAANIRNPRSPERTLPGDEMPG